ncbi:MAG: ABC transporter ATP-binding protein [Armatimonadota bacterium]
MEEKSRIKTFSRLLDFLRPHWRKVLTGVVSLTVVALLDLIPARVYGFIVDKLLINKANTPLNDRLRLLGLIAIGLVLLKIISATFDRIRACVMHILGERFIMDLSRKIYEHVQTLSLTFFESQQTGEVMSRVTNDCQVVEEFVTHVADTVIADVLKVILIVIILFCLNPTLAFVTLIPVPLLGYVSFRYSRRVRKMYRACRERYAAINAKLQDNLSGIRVIKSFAREDYEYGRYSQETLDYFNMRVNVINIWTIFMPLTQLIVGFDAILLWWYGGGMIVRQEMTLGIFMSFIFYMGMFHPPVLNIARINDTIQRALAAADRIFELLDTKPDLEDAPDAKPIPPITGSVTFDNVHFSYATGEEVLSGINIHAKPGQIVALVGRSGAGKTSIVNLIPRFYDPSKGRILIDGIDVRTVTQQSLRSQIGIVLQETFLFNGTIRENILYGRLDATEEEMIKAAKAAHADEYIVKMPQGYDTEIGERGIKLSGGQKQRLAIARAILANPRILILDEATSSVDSESEYLIHKAMDRLMQDRTTFVIAHRLSTIKHADIIITLEHGQIVEVGDHKTLLDLDGTYSQMYEAQYKLESELS